MLPLSVLLASLPLNGVCLLVQCYGMIMTPRLSKCHLALLWREGKQVNYHDNGDAESAADSGHRMQDDRDDFLITNGKQEALISLNADRWTGSPRLCLKY